MLTHRGGAAAEPKWAETAIWTALESEDLSRISSRNVSPQELLPFMRRFVEIGTIGEEYVGTRERQRLRIAGRGVAGPQRRTQQKARGTRVACGGDGGSARRATVSSSFNRAP